jgi:hypothetical protein
VINLRANGHPNGCRWRQFHCTSCDAYRRRIVGVNYRVAFGTMERVQQVLSACGCKINTAFMKVRPVGRKETSVSG